MHNGNRIGRKGLAAVLLAATMLAPAVPAAAQDRGDEGRTPAREMRGGGDRGGEWRGRADRGGDWRAAREQRTQDRVQQRAEPQVRPAREPRPDWRAAH